MFKCKKIDVSFAIFMFLMTLFMMYKVHLGLHYDEAYLVNLGKIKMDGIKSVSECWDILQFCGLLVYPFMQFFHVITHNYAGVILYFRYIYIIIHLLIALYAYFTLKQILTITQARIISCISFLFSFYWYTICYRSVLYWGLFLSVLFLIRYLNSNKLRYISFSAISFCVSTICFPTVIFMVVPITVFFIKYSKNRKTELLLFWLTCIICAVIFILGLIYESGIKLLLSTIKNTISYESSNNNHKLITCLELAILLLAGELVYRIYNYCQLKLFKNYYSFILLFITFFILIIIFIRPKSAGISRFWYTYILLFYLLLPTFREYKEINNYYVIKYLFVDFSIYLQYVIAISSANGLAIAAYGCIFGLMGELIILFHEKQVYEKKMSCTFLGYELILLFLFSMLFFIPDNELGSSNILWKRESITRGPAKGIRVTEKTLDKYNDICDVVELYVKKDNNLCIISDGFRSYGFLDTEAKQVSHWPYIVYPDSNRAVVYYQQFSHLKPTIILINKKFVEQYYNTFSQWIEKSSLGKYISEEYTEISIYKDWIVYK